MAIKTKSIQATGSTGWHYFTLTVNEDSYSIERNESSISWTFKISPKHNGYDWAGWHNNVNYSVNVNGSITTDYVPDYDGVSDIVWASGSQVISHNNDGKKRINLSFSVNSSGNTTYYLPGTAAASDVMDLTDIPRKAKILSGPSKFNDTESPSIGFDNPLGYDATYLQAAIGSIDGTVIVPYKEIEDKTASAYKYNLTDADRKLLLQSVVGSNTKQLGFFLATTIGDIWDYDVYPTTFEVVNALPSLNPTVIDVGETSTKLTGDPNKMIKGFNQMRATANAQAYKEATIKDIKIINGNDTRFTGSEDFTFTNSNVFEFRINDSRNNPVQKTITVPMVEYIPLTCNVEGEIELDSTDNTKSVITLNISGNYFKGSFGAVSNTLEITYLLEYDGGTETTQSISIPSTAGDNGTYSISYTIPKKLDYKKSYTVKVVAKDKIYSYTVSTKTLKAIPVFDWSETDFNFNVPVYINGVPIVANTILWEGAALMGSGHTATLNAPISSQHHGIILVFSGFVDGGAVNYYICSHVVPKSLVSALPGAPHTFMLVGDAKMAYAGAKYLYIDDTSIRGHADNEAVGTGVVSTIGYNNNRWVLRYVIGF